MVVGGGVSEAAACGGGLGSEFMMLTGGIDCEDGNWTFGPGGVTGPLGALDASGRDVRVGQFTA